MLDPTIVGLIGILVVFLLLFLGLPIAFTMMLVGFSGVAYLTSIGSALPMIARAVYEVSADYNYTVIPLFIIMGGFAGSSGMVKDLYGAFDKWFRRIPGGLAIATIAACGVFAAISGSSVATAAAMGSVAIPEMKRYNYHPRLYAGVLAAGGTLGFLIPPSIGFLVFGMLTEQSIGKLLIAGIIPGFLLASAYILIIMFLVRKNPELAPVNVDSVSWQEKFISLKGIREPLFVFFVVIGGIYSGLFTPTEAGAIGATLLFLIALIKKSLTKKNLLEAFQETMRISIMVLLLVAGANMLSYFLALSTIPMKVVEWITLLDVSRYWIIVIILLIYLFLGCFLDSISMMVLTLPVVFPVIIGIGFDPIWFGVISVLMMEAGLITPPLGLNIFTVAGVAKDVKMETIFRGASPFLIAIFAVVLLITLFPQIVLVLPKMMR